MPKASNLSKCPPPKGFRPAGLIQTVELSDTGPRPLIKRKSRYTPVQKLGMGFERKVQENLFNRFDNYVPSPWIRFLERGESARRRRWRWCQPDGFFIDYTAGRISIVEIKLRHTSGAWWQIRRLYEPVLKHLFGPAWSFTPIEVVKWYDGTVPFPEFHGLSPDPRGLADGRFGVHIIKP